MAIILNDNIRINAGKPADAKYLSTGNTAYASIAAVNAAITVPERHKGLTVLIASGTSSMEFWYLNGVTDSDLIQKKYDSVIPDGDFITGATNIGFFSGQTGIQTLPISKGDAATYNGNYISLYNYYFRGTDGKIHTDEASDGIRRRGYVRPPTIPSPSYKSWIWNEYLGDAAKGWVFIDDNIEDNIGQFLAVQPAASYTPQFTANTWTTFCNSGSVLVSTPLGSLTTGNTLTIGGPVFQAKDGNHLHFRTLISDTPNLRVSYDESFVHLSGTSAVINALNVGSGNAVYKTQTGSTLVFRTLIPSGDTSITQNGDNLIIFSSSNGSGYAITGGTNIGNTGGTGIYAGTIDRNAQFRTLSGGTNTTIVETGGTIVINSTGGGGVFTSDLLVSIAAGKTFGKYLNGDTIPASGKTANEVIQMALVEALEPTVTLSSSASDVVFGLSAKTVNLTFSYTINTMGATVASVLLEWRRGATGAWSGLTTSTGATTFNHIINETNRFNTAVINFRYTVTDSAAATKTVIYDITPQAYGTPTYSPSYTGSILGYETQTIREKGNINTTIAGSLTSNRSLVYIKGYEIQRCVDGGAFTTIATCSGLCTLTPAITSCLDSGAAGSANSIGYRIAVYDDYCSATPNCSGTYTINYRFASYYGYCTSTSISGAQIVALGNQALCTSKARTMVLTAPASNYTYVSYPESFGYLTSAIMDGAAPVLGAFTCACDCSVTNNYGQTVDYILYKSNAPQAFTANSVAFS